MLKGTLILTFSQKEKELFTTDYFTLNGLSKSVAFRRRLPLPGGEGWGEGRWLTHSPDSAP